MIECVVHLDGTEIPGIVSQPVGWLESVWIKNSRCPTLIVPAARPNENPPFHLALRPRLPRLFDFSCAAKKRAPDAILPPSAPFRHPDTTADRKSVVYGKSVELG